MVRYLEWKDVFEWKWDDIASTFWKRYPNPESAHVLSEDTISREVKDGMLYTKRLLTKTNNPPKWAEKIISTRIVKILEESIIDAKGKKIISYTRNIGYVKVMSVVEKVVYKEDEENSNMTIAERSAWIESKMFGLNRAIEAFGIDRFHKNSLKAVKGFNYVLNSVFPKTEKSPLDDNANHINSSKSKEKLIGAAKKASHLAKSKAEKIYANTSYQSSQNT